MTPWGRGAARADQTSILSSWVSCLAIIVLSSFRFVVSPVRDLVSRDSRELPTQLSRVRDRGACTAVLAVPSVPVEEHQMRRGASVDREVHPKEQLHGRSRAALLAGIQLPHRRPDHRRRRYRTTLPARDQLDGGRSPSRGGGRRLRGGFAHRRASLPRALFRLHRTFLRRLAGPRTGTGGARRGWFRSPLRAGGLPARSCLHVTN